jgi:alkanesulfonate monooxygenase SsuD/methylene tetrahydromethanopterin reductase-like flavin-dependent oxidoreductase (luciferase family)
MALQSIGVSLTGSFPQGMPAIGEMLENVRRAERLGFDAIWSGDHIIMHSPIMDVMTVLATAAAITTRVKLGTAVYLMPLRHPVATAKQVASLDLLSNGRFIFGVGVGGEIIREFEAVGVPVHERGRRTWEILTRVLSGDNGAYQISAADSQRHPGARPGQQPIRPSGEAFGPPCGAGAFRRLLAGLSRQSYAFTGSAQQIPPLRPSTDALTTIQGVVIFIIARD